MTRWFDRCPVFTLLLINLAFIGLVILLVEIFIRIFIPYPLVTIGRVGSSNASIYGWGYNPHEVIMVSDPDTGVTYVDKVNNHGFRDLERYYENKKGAYRILVLGDSVTYGAIVPGDKIYTRILNERFLAIGYNVEVISLAYGGWGTDQELEALIKEGVHYKPDLIIVQFCTNDLTDNAYFHYAMTSQSEFDRQRKGWKPFFYELSDANDLLKHDNPFFSQNKAAITKLTNFLKEYVVNRSEILKRFWILFRSTPSNDSREPTYAITKSQVDQLQLVLNLSDSSNLLVSLNTNIGQKFNREGLNTILKLEDKAMEQVVFRVLEDRWFHQYWSKDSYFPKKYDPKSYLWRLYLALIGRMSTIANQIGADLAVFSETDKGAYDWEVSWFRVMDDEESRKSWMSHVDLLEQDLPKIGVKVIPSKRLYERARNDSHSNIRGNIAMADDIFDWVMTHYKHKLDNYKKTGALHQGTVK